MPSLFPPCPKNKLRMAKEGGEGPIIVTCLEGDRWIDPESQFSVAPIVSCPLTRPPSLPPRLPDLPAVSNNAETPTLFVCLFVCLFALSASAHFPPHAITAALKAKGIGTCTWQPIFGEGEERGEFSHRQQSCHLCKFAFRNAYASSCNQTQLRRSKCIREPL